MEDEVDTKRAKVKEVEKQAPDLPLHDQPRVEVHVEGGDDLQSKIGCAAVWLGSALHVLVHGVGKRKQCGLAGWLSAILSSDSSSDS